MADHHPELRASDADREKIVDQLRRHLGEGRLDLTEFEERAGDAFAARTMGDLAAVVADLPVLRQRTSGPPARVRPSRPPRPARSPAAATAVAGWDIAFRIHLYLWLILSGFLTVIWLFTGGMGDLFWPIFPIAGIGMSVGVHAAVRKAVLDS